MIDFEYEDARKRGRVVLDRWRAQYLRRMWDLSEFMKTLKQKFSAWFNRKHDRVGTLWESRFKSVLVEGSWTSLLKVAAYVDLNAVRAGLVDDPKDYRWCGYGEAVAGDRAARRGLCAALNDVKSGATWRDLGPRYLPLADRAPRSQSSGFRHHWLRSPQCDSNRRPRGSA